MTDTNETMAQTQRTENENTDEKGYIPDDELLAEIERLADELDKTPTLEEMNEHGKYSTGTCYNRFGSWTEAVKAAGLEPNQGRHIPDDELLDELEWLADKLGRKPTVEEMDGYGEYSAATYQSRFGSWPIALDEANLL